MNYTNKLLASQPTSRSEFFKESVILVIEDSPKTGTWGLQLNKQTDTLKVNTVVSEIGVHIDTDKNCFIGGPVEPNALHIVHSSDCIMSNTIPINDNLNVTSNQSLFEELQRSRGPSDWIITLGMCTWAPHQLAGEMSGEHPWTPQHKWLVTDCPKDVLNINPKLLWKQIVKTCVEEATASMF